MEETEFLRVWSARLLEGGLRALAALFALILTVRLASRLCRRLERRLVRRGIDKTAARAIGAAVRYGTILVVALLLLALVGVDTAALTALFTSIGVGAGLAVNGALANLAGGILLLLTRPFKLDDYVEAAGQEGTVEDIRLVTTRLRTVDNRIIYLPNGTVSSGTIINYSENPIRRLELVFLLGESADTAAARDLLLALAAGEARILKSPEPYAVLIGRDELGVQLSLRAYVHNPDYWDVRCALLEAANTALLAAGMPPASRRVDIGTTA